MLKKILLGLLTTFTVSAGATIAFAADIEVGNGSQYADFNQLIEAVSNGNLILNQDDTIKLVSDITMSNSITITNGIDLNFNMNQHKITSQNFDGRPFKIESGASVHVYGDGEIYSDSYGAFDVYGELTIDDGYYYAIGYSDIGGGAVLRTRPGSSLTINDGVKVLSETSAAVYSEGELIAGKCELISKSHNGLKTPSGVELWSYCTQCLGNGVFNGTIVQGVQGGLYIGGKGIINGGTYTAAELNDGTYTGNKAFYGLYISNDATVTINDGTFNAGSYSYCVLNSDNDTGMPLSDRVVIKGGVFNGEVGTKVGAEKNVAGFTIYGGQFSDIGQGEYSILNCIPAGYEINKSNDSEYYVVGKSSPINMGEAKQFKETSSGEESGYYFNVTKNISAVTTKAEIILNSESEQKSITETLILPTMSGGGASISILVLDAPSDITGTIEFK